MENQGKTSKAKILFYAMMLIGLGWALGQFEIEVLDYCDFDVYWSRGDAQ